MTKRGIKMKQLILCSLMLLVTGSVYAGTISRTNYTDGNTITAALQNTNENTIVNEINGNLDSTNLSASAGIVGTQLSASAGITGTQLSASAGITASQMASSAQSTFTYVNTLGAYRRPRLTWIDRVTVDMENNTGTSNESCVHFPNERRCVTENTSSTHVNRRLLLTATASMSGTKDSGIRSGVTLTNNTWYSFYAAKVTDNSTDFVVVADTVTPVQANFAALNNIYGINGWLYLGVLPYGNRMDNPNSLVNFQQNQNYTMLFSTVAGAQGLDTGHFGIVLSSGANSTGRDWAYASGISLSASQIPSHISIADFLIHGSSYTDHTASGVVASFSVSSTDLTRYYYIRKADTGPVGSGGGPNNVLIYNIPVAQGIEWSMGYKTSDKGGVGIVGYYDYIISNGFNPQL